MSSLKPAARRDRLLGELSQHPPLHPISRVVPERKVLNMPLLLGPFIKARDDAQAGIDGAGVQFNLVF